MAKKLDINPDDYDTFPAEMVAAILPDDIDLKAVQQSLTDSGVGSERISFLVGEEGLRTLDPEGKRDGLFAQLKRAMESVSMEGPAFEAATKALEDGETVISVTDTPDEDADSVRQTLIEAGATEAFHFGRWTISPSGTIVTDEETVAGSEERDETE